MNLIIDMGKNGKKCGNKFCDLTGNENLNLNWFLAPVI